MSPQEFISKWRASTVNERAASQEHFIDLCRLLGEPTPIQADPTGTFYRFEKAVSKARGGDGSADVWKRGCFGWEYKGKKRDLHQAYAQLLDYSDDLENPPLLIVSDMETLKVHTHFTNSVQQVHIFGLDDLLEPQTPRSRRPRPRSVARTARPAVAPVHDLSTYSPNSATYLGRYAPQTEQQGYLWFTPELGLP